METLFSPFKLFWAVLSTMLLIAGYTVVFLIQAICFSARNNRDGIIEAFGWYGKSVVNAISEIFKS